MASTNRSGNIVSGAEVFDAGGGKLGKVVDVERRYIVVEHGFPVPTDYYVPTSAIAKHDGDQVHLSVTKREIVDRDWLAPPGDEEPFGDLSGPTDEGQVLGRRPLTDTDETIRLPLHEEELVAGTRERQIGEVRVTKEVLIEDREIDVPLQEERVRVTRRAVDREPDAGTDLFQETSVTIPVRGQRAEITKRPHVVEEVEVGKEAVQYTDRIHDTIRREEVRTEGVTIDDDPEAPNTPPDRR